MNQKGYNDEEHAKHTSKNISHDADRYNNLKNLKLHILDNVNSSEFNMT